MIRQSQPPSRTEAIAVDVRRLLAETLHLDEGDIDETQLLSRYGMNSVDLIDIVARLERQHGILFDALSMKNLTCRSLTENVKRLLTENGRPRQP